MEIPEPYGEQKETQTAQPKSNRNLPLFNARFYRQLLFYTWCRVQSVRIKYEITEQTSRIRQMSAMQDNLKIEFARLKSPSRIAKIARTQLGLITPTSTKMILMP